MEPQVHGSVLFLHLFDVCEEIKLDDVRELLGATPQPRSFKDASPEYVKFEKPPVVEALTHAGLTTPNATGRVKFYDYGVISVMIEVPFSGRFADLVQSASKWMSSPEFETAATQVVREKVQQIGPAIIRRYPNWIDEEYFVHHIRSVDEVKNASELFQRHGEEIAQIIRGETLPLSKEERTEILQASVSYFPNDVAVIGWNASVVFDSLTGAQTAIQLLEYANSQLLEFRFYDEYLTRELSTVYSYVKKGRGMFSRWTLPRQLTRLQSITLEVSELVERVDNSIKFVSDMFSARLYRLAAAKVGVPDYKSLVAQKLEIAEDLYRSLNDEFQAARGFVLELMVVIILIIELFYLFRGK
jgi:hypothetical protein